MRVSLTGLLLCALFSVASGARADEFYENTLPSDTIAVLSASDFGALYKQGMESPLGKILAADPEISKSVTDKFNRISMLASLVMNLPDDQRAELLSSGCTVALLPLRAQEAETQNLSVVVAFDISNLGRPAQDEIKRAITGVVRLVLQGKGEVTVRADGCDIKLAERKDQQLKILFKDGLIMAGFAPDIDALPAERVLAQNDYYKKVKAQLPEGEKIAGYLNFDALLAELDRHHPDIERMDKLKQIGVKNAAALAFSTRFTPDGVKQDIYLALHQPITSWLKYLPTKKDQPQGDRFVPQGFDLFASADFGPGANLIDAARSAIAEVAGSDGVQRWDNFLDSIGSSFSISVKADVLASLGGEVFFAADYDHLAETIKQDKLDSDKPYLVGCRLAENASLAKALKRIFESEVLWNEYGLETSTLEYDGCTITTFSNVTEPWIRDAYCFVDGYFLYSPNLDTLKQSLDAWKSGKNLIAEPNYRKLKNSTPKELNVYFYGRSSVIYEQLLKAYLPFMDGQITPVAKAFSNNANALTDAVASLELEDDCIRVRLLTPTGLEGIMVSGGKFKEAAIRRKVQISREAMDTVETALEAYYKKNGTYPRNLEVLQPEYLRELPEDPYARYPFLFLLEVPPMPVRYYSAAAPKGENITAYALATNGPDGTIDFMPLQYDPKEWADKQNSTDTDDLSELKAAFYQFKPDVNKDESAPDDEGDVVVFRSETEQGGAR